MSIPVCTACSRELYAGNVLDPQDKTRHAKCADPSMLHTPRSIRFVEGVMEFWWEGRAEQ
ncbi:hypothetical protein LCGC14_1901920 [marine sediment metagenome]|uniref:Uncharacterized protein n=1 Tax=marine sediment metagenome TaxID=412755 RepID=A0A0F9FWJ7_9ZZZZ